MMNAASDAGVAASGLVIAFDADDTLWHNEAYYRDALQRLQALLSDRLEPAQVERTLAETEARNIAWYGYGIKSYTLSMVETAAAVLGEGLTGDLVNAIIRIGRDMLSADVLLFEHTEEALIRLAQDHELMLITKGDLVEQNNKVKKSGLARRFKFIEIVEEKTADGYRALLTRHGIPAAQFLMVGNSLKSDVLPVLEIGARAVFVPYELTWSHEHADGGGHTYFEIEHLGLLPDLIERLTTDA